MHLLVNLWHVCWGHTQEEKVGSRVHIFSFIRYSQRVSKVLIRTYTFPAEYKASSYTTFLSTLGVVHHFHFSHSGRCLEVLYFICNFLMKEILKEISPGISLEGLVLKLKLQYFGHLMRKVESLEKTLMLGGIGGRRSRGRQRMRWLDGITASMEWVSVNSGSWCWTGRPGVLWFMGSQRVGHDWTELNWKIY